MHDEQTRPGNSPSRVFIFGWERLAALEGNPPAAQECQTGKGHRHQEGDQGHGSQGGHRANRFIQGGLNISRDRGHVSDVGLAEYAGYDHGSGRRDFDAGREENLVRNTLNLEQTTLSRIYGVVDHGDSAPCGFGVATPNNKRPDGNRIEDRSGSPIRRFEPGFRAPA